MLFWISSFFQQHHAMLRISQGKQFVFNSVNSNFLWNDDKPRACKKFETMGKSSINKMTNAFIIFANSLYCVSLKCIHSYDINGCIQRKFTLLQPTFFISQGGCMTDIQEYEMSKFFIFRQQFAKETMLKCYWMENTFELWTLNFLACMQTSKEHCILFPWYFSCWILGQQNILWLWYSPL